MLFITVCLLFSSSRSLFNISFIFCILFQRFGIIFTIITLNSFSGRLPFSSSFIWSYRFLHCSFICNIFFVVSFYFFDVWSHIPVLLVVWPEASSTEVCRQLCRAGSWCQDEDIWEASLQLIFPGI